MAFKHGRNAVVMFNGTNMSGYLTGGDIQIDVDNADTTNLASGGNRENIAGLSQGTYSFDGFLDAAAPIPAALGTDAGVLSVCVGGGSTIGDLVDLASITSTGYGRSVSMDGAAAISWALVAQEYIGFGQLLHVLGTDTNTTTGTGKDDTASTSTGWTGHLHVTANTGAGTWVVKVQDSPDNSSWADVTGFSFTSVSSAGGQRLKSAAVTTTLRRYVRYVATRTGGSAGDTITFQLGYSRNRA